MNEQERKDVIGRIAAEYGIRIDANDPSLMIVDMCARVLDARLAEIGQRTQRSSTSAADLAAAISKAYSEQVLPKLQATVKAEVGAALDRVQRPSIWTHPAFVGVSAGLAGVVLGFMLRAIA